jgi:hypothetical protein
MCFEFQSIELGVSVDIVNRLWMEDRRIGVRVRVSVSIYLFFKTSISALGPTQPLIQWVPWAISLRAKAAGSV